MEQIHSNLWGGMQLHVMLFDLEVFSPYLFENGDSSHLSLHRLVLHKSSFTVLQRLPHSVAASVHRKKAAITRSIPGFSTLQR